MVKCFPPFHLEDSYAQSLRMQNLYDTDLFTLLSLCLQILSMRVRDILVIIVLISLAAVVLAVGCAGVAVARQFGLIVGDLLALPLAKVHRLCRLRCLRAQHVSK